MNEDAARETVEHLQNAAVEMIRATRAFLDLLEDMVGDAAPLLGLLGEMAARARTAPAPAGEPRVQHIRVG
jgi:hypothetical protein